MSNKPIPVLVGAAQFTQRKDEIRPLDPLSLMVETSRSALADAGANGLSDLIDSVYVMNIMGWSYRDAPGKLSETLGLKPSEKIYSPIGGNMPQKFLNRAAYQIASGRSRAILLAGGEADYAIRRSVKGEIVLDWPARRKPKKIDGDTRFSTSDLENSYHLIIPPPVYAIFETAFRAAKGRNHEEHVQCMGQLLESFSRIASRHSYAWAEEVYSAEEITTPIPGNRYICYPYTMRMVSNRYVDQSAALVMTSEEVAGRLGIDRRHWVYPMGGSDLQNIFYLCQRPQIHASPAIREGARLSLEQAGLSLDDIDMFDIYSCFPSMVEIAMEAMDIPEDDPRDLTVTGGLPYFGGPFNSYSMNAIATVVDRIRGNPSSKAMVLAVGGVNSKISTGVYGTEPPKVPWGERDDTAVQEAINAESLPEPIVKANGMLTVEGYTVHYDRKQQPELGTVIGKLENGRRTLAHIKAEKETLREFEQKDLVGQTGEVNFDSSTGLNRVTFKGGGKP